MPMAQVVVALALSAMQAGPPSQATLVKAQFERENDPVRKAKLVEKLGDAQFDEIRKQVADGNLDSGLATLETYRDECRKAHAALKAARSDAENKPAGFKQLQISVRESLNRLTEIMAGLTAEEQKPFLPVRKQLEELNSQLIHELFPRQAGSAGAPAKPKK